MFSELNVLILLCISSLDCLFLPIFIGVLACFFHVKERLKAVYGILKPYYNELVFIICIDFVGLYL